MTARAARVCVGMRYCGQLWSLCVFMGVILWCVRVSPYASIHMCNQREVAPAGAAVPKTTLLFKDHASSAGEGEVCGGEGRADGVLVASSAHKDSIHQLSDAGSGRWVRGLDRSASPDLSGFCGCVEGYRRVGEEGEWVEKNVPICQVLPPTTPTFSNQR